MRKGNNMSNEIDPSVTTDENEAIATEPEKIFTLEFTPEEVKKFKEKFLEELKFEAWKLQVNADFDQTYLPKFEEEIKNYEKQIEEKKAENKTLQESPEYHKKVNREKWQVNSKVITKMEQNIKTIQDIIEKTKDIPENNESKLKDVQARIEFINKL